MKEILFYEDNQQLEKSMKNIFCYWNSNKNVIDLPWKAAEKLPIY